MKKIKFGKAELSVAEFISVVAMRLFTTIYLTRSLAQRLPDYFVIKFAIWLVMDLAIGYITMRMIGRATLKDFYVSANEELKAVLKEMETETEEPKDIQDK